MFLLCLTLSHGLKTGGSVFCCVFVFHGITSIKVGEAHKSNPNPNLNRNPNPSPSPSSNIESGPFISILEQL